MVPRCGSALFASMTKVQTGAGVSAREAPPFDRGPHGFKRDLAGDRGTLLVALQKLTRFRLLLATTLHMHTKAISEFSDAHASPRRRGGSYRTGPKIPE
jgi:hypothetical protein